MEQSELNDKLIYEYLKDPRVMSAAALAGLTYMRASDVHSLLNRWTSYVKKQSGLDDVDVGVSNFWKVIATIPTGFSGWLLAETADRLLIKNEVNRLQKDYKKKLAIYNRDYPLWQQKATLEEPEFPENPLSIIQVAIYKTRLAEWTYIQNLDEPILPTRDPAIAAWNEKGEVTQQDAATYALIAFIIGLNPSIVPEALKGVGEIVKGIGEIVPL